MAADMCVAVTKYSHAIGVRPDNTIPWVHVVTSNVFLVLKSEDTHLQNGKLLMQVIQGNSVLETIRAGELIDKAIKARHGSQQVGIQPQIEQLPIFGIRKDNLLAFRYRWSDGQARRLQFRVASLEESTHLAGLLERRGMEFQQQRPRTSRPTTARPETSGAPFRPLTTQTSYAANSASNVPATTAKESPFQLQALEAGDLSSRHQGFMSSTARLDQTQPRLPSLDHTTWGVPLQATARTTTPQALGPNPDQTFPVPGLPRSYTTSSRHFADATTSFGHGASSLSRKVSTLADPGSDVSVGRQFVEHETSGLTDNSAPAEHDAETHRSSFQARSVLPSDSGAHLSNLEVPNSSSPPTSSHHSSSRPFTAASIRMPETLEHEMPPRRELPFKRPGSHQSASSRPSTAANSIPHSTTAGGSSESTAVSSALSPKRMPGTVRPATASTLKRPMAPIFADPVKKALAVEARPQSHASIPSKAPSSRMASKSTKEIHSDGPIRRPSNLGELLRVSKPLVERSPNSNKVARLDSLADAHYEVETPPGSSSSPTKTSVTAVSSSPDKAAGQLSTSPGRINGPTMPTSPLRSTVFTNRDPSGPLPGATTAVTHPPPQGGEAHSLADYAAQSQEDRQTVLDEFMVSKLEDPNFAVLCEDLDSCWRRIALGL